MSRRVGAADRIHPCLTHYMVEYASLLLENHIILAYLQFMATDSPELGRSPKLLENTLLVCGGLIAYAPLYYQLPRWANGLDPTFVHPKWMAQSSYPILFHMAEVHPRFWIAVTIVIFIRLCRNYGWRLEPWRELVNTHETEKLTKVARLFRSLS
jgi:hypothetical protein